MAIITAIEGSTHGIIHQTDTTSLDTRGICEGTYPEDVSIPLHAAWMETTFQDPGGWLFFFLFIPFFSGGGSTLTFSTLHRIWAAAKTARSLQEEILLPSNRELAHRKGGQTERQLYLWH